MEHDRYRDDYIAGILDETKTVALVGASPSPRRASHEVMNFLQAMGYRVIPVNPNGGAEILGEKVYGSLAEIPHAFELVDIFRKSEDAAGVADEAIAVAREKGIRTLWMQLDVRDDAAAGRAEKAGLKVVMDRCPKIEYSRLRGVLTRNAAGKW